MRKLVLFLALTMLIAQVVMSKSNIKRRRDYKPFNVLCKTACKALGGQDCGWWSVNCCVPGNCMVNMCQNRMAIPGCTDDDGIPDFPNQGYNQGYNPNQGVNQGGFPNQNYGNNQGGLGGLGNLANSLGQLQNLGNLFN